MSDNNNKIFYSVKFIIIGNQSVGKTNIVHRFAKGAFSNEYTITGDSNIQYEEIADADTYMDFVFDCNNSIFEL